MFVAILVIAAFDHRFGWSHVPLPLVIAGLGFAGAGLMLTGLDVSTPLAYQVAAYLLFGTGFGMLNTPVTNTAGPSPSLKTEAPGGGTLSRERTTRRGW